MWFSRRYLQLWLDPLAAVAVLEQLVQGSELAAVASRRSQHRNCHKIWN
jgi:hypothetical protein